MELNVEDINPVKYFKRFLKSPILWIMISIAIVSLITSAYLVFTVGFFDTFTQPPTQPQNPQTSIDDVTFSFESYNVSESRDTVEVTVKIESITGEESADISYYTGNEQEIITNAQEGDTFTITADYGIKVRLGYINNNDSFVETESFDAV